MVNLEFVFGYFYVAPKGHAIIAQTAVCILTLDVQISSDAPVGNYRWLP